MLETTIEERAIAAPYERQIDGIVGGLHSQIKRSITVRLEPVARSLPGCSLRYLLRNDQQAETGQQDSQDEPGKPPVIYHLTHAMPPFLATYVPPRWIRSHPEGVAES
jgi:hypothetical protein